MNGLVSIESQKRLSESSVWNVQREYFDRVGVDAWANNVPHFITCNPFIAKAYAEMAIRFIQDWCAQHPASNSEPFYFIELGAGTGKFGFYAIQALMELTTALKLDIQIRYVITDFTESNLKFWQQHPKMAPFVEAGVLDFALYNLDQPGDLTLLNSHQRLTAQSLKNPLITVANYIFDAVTQDVFILENDQLFEGLISLKTPPANYENQQVKDWSAVEIQYTPGRPAETYYEIASLNQVLKDHIQQLKSSQFLIPFGGIKAMMHLRTLTAHDQMLVLCSDKAYNRIEDFENMRQSNRGDYGKGHFAMVNLYAVGQFFKHEGGSALLQGPRPGLKTGVFSIGLHFEDYPNFYHSAHQQVREFSPIDYFNYHRFISDQFKQASLEQLVSHLHVSGYDPYMLSRLMPHIRELVEKNKADPLSKLYLLEALPKIAQNYYFMPNVADSLFDVGVLFYLMGDYANALSQYEASKNYFGESSGLLFNIGLCQYYLGDKKLAIVSFAKSSKLDPNFKDATEWIEFLRKEMGTPS